MHISCDFQIYCKYIQWNLDTWKNCKIHKYLLYTVQCRCVDGTINHCIVFQVLQLFHCTWRIDQILKVQWKKRHSGKLYTIHAPLKAAACIFFNPFFTATYILERLILQSGQYFMIIFPSRNKQNVIVSIKIIS